MRMFEEGQTEQYEPTEQLPEGERACSCCFSGHRRIVPSERSRVLYRLRSTVLWLVSKGITNFYAGGALGFDTIAATTVIDLKRTEPKVRLILELPYESQNSGWSENDKRIYAFIKENADEIHICGENPENREKASQYLHIRNREMVEHSSYCVCYLKNRRGGTAYTVNYAKKCDLDIINLAEDETKVE